jgi:hypothetical protein
MLAECVNSLLHPVLDGRKHTDQGCLELFRFLHNVRPFERGKRAHHSPAQLVGLDVPDDPLTLLGLAPNGEATRSRQTLAVGDTPLPPDMTQESLLLPDTEKTTEAASPVLLFLPTILWAKKCQSNLPRF